MKKLLALVLALVMSMSLVTISNAAYSDKADIDLKEAVDVLSAVGVFEGSDGKFDPKANLTREQAAKLVAYLQLSQKSADALVGGNKFTDVAANRWSAGYVDYCATTGVVAGVGNGQFNPTGSLTALQFGTYWPAPASLLAELGENYGLDNYSMWFNGAYLLSEFKPNEKRVYTKNENNWDAEHIYIERIEQTCNTEATTLAPELFLRGEIDYADIGSDIVADWLSDPEKSQMISSSRVIGDYSYFFGFNFEPKFDAEYEPENWAIAVNNENFRKAVFHGINRDEYLAAKYPGDDPSIHKINTVTPKGFSVNEGKDYVFYGGLAKYTEGESFDPELAVQFRDAAKAELEAAGCKFPIKVPVNYNTSSTTWANCTVVLEQQLEELLGADFIDIIVVPYSGSSFLKETRRNGNYALQELNWGADFMDPETWADPFDHKNSYNFFCNETLEQDGINQYTKTEETAALIDQYFELVAAAREETGDMNARYEAFAAAESFYIDHAIVVPGFISGGSYQATKLNAFEGQYAMMGQSSSRYKGQHVYKTAMSQDMFDAQYAEWTAAMEG